ncbi:AMP-binding protein [Barrientosiimonas endolithica]|nr:AMP-binding protein [Barrientosiimonas endolithica]
MAPFNTGLPWPGAPIRPYAVAPDRLPAYVEALAAMLEGDGPALLPYADGDPEPAVPDDADLPDDLGLVVSTSGSTGAPKRAMLTRAALRASGTATHDRLGGEGMWLLPLPAQHIAGTQVILRSSLRAEHRCCST